MALEAAREISFYRGNHLTSGDLPRPLLPTPSSRLQDCGHEAAARKKWLEGATLRLGNARRGADRSEHLSQDSIGSSSTCFASSRGGASCSGSSKGRAAAALTMDSLPEGDDMHRIGSGSLSGGVNSADLEDAVSFRMCARVGGHNDPTMESLQEWDCAEEGGASPSSQMAAKISEGWFPERFPEAKLSPRTPCAIPAWTPPTREDVIQAISSPALQKSLSRVFPEWRQSKGLFRMPCRPSGDNKA
mmetsp:Transcript_4182/g.11907  ORF Transcript_4182/g.11907 Transcript_4182/m.11907 type:complete len:246 (+) Transcript_4182:154-891(+)